MKIMVADCSCDKCGRKMDEGEYEIAVHVTIKIDLPDLHGRSGECGGVDMRLCSECAEGMGLVNSAQYHETVNAQSNLNYDINRAKAGILNFFFKKKA